MPDVLTSLTYKKQKLVSVKDRLRRETEARIKEIDREIDEIDNAINVINDAIKPLLCSVCNGAGNVRRCDAAGSMEDVDCSACHGTGIIGA